MHARTGVREGHARTHHATHANSHGYKTHTDTYLKVEKLLDFVGECVFHDLNFIQNELARQVGGAALFLGSGEEEAIPVVLNT